VTRNNRQALISGSLAGLLIAAWAVCHVYGVFFYRWTAAGVLLAPLLMALQCWLNVGLFIVAHDCMHGSFAPHRPTVNRMVGRLCLGLYAGFWFDRLLDKHHAHHRHSGTANDPDFDMHHPNRMLPWFGSFFRTYFGAREAVVITALVCLYLVLGAAPANMIVLWAVPALLSAVQLFYFGTFLPHRHEREPFAGRHNARSTDFSWLISLLTCFHFGYHDEHHEYPAVPWWGLPAVRASERVSPQPVA
jgi:beta-carotene ketolase (CrtW type)